MKKHLFVLLVLISFGATAQEELNAYKYVVIPSKFDFQKKADQYGINTLLKYKFQQLGFETYLDSEELPAVLKEEGCLVISPIVKNYGDVFVTKVIVEMTDCLKQVLFTTKEGKSRSKSYKTSYNIAIREALTSFDNYKLAYSPKEDEAIVNAEADKQLEIEKLKAEVAALKKSSNNIIVEKEDNIASTKANVVEAESYLIAHKKSNGFLLVNSASDKVDYIIHTTKMKDVFVLKDKSGVIYKTATGWVREYVDKERTVLEFLEIKF